MRISLIGCVVLLSAVAVNADQPVELVVHEWGTLKNAHGEAITGLFNAKPPPC